MSNRRRADTAKKEGIELEQDTKQMAKDLAAGEKIRASKEQWRNELKSSSLFKFIKWGKLGKDVADGVLGFAPWVGDVLTFGIGMVNMFFCAVKVRSLALTLIVGLLSLIDLLIGCIPGAGDILDFIFPSNYMSVTLIEKYIDGKCRWIDYLSWVLVALFILSICAMIYLGFHLYQNL